MRHVAPRAVTEGKELIIAMISSKSYEIIREYSIPHTATRETFRISPYLGHKEIDALPLLGRPRHWISIPQAYFSSHRALIPSSTILSTY